MWCPWPVSGAKERWRSLREWLKDTHGANAPQSWDCFGCLPEWCDTFLWGSLGSPQSLVPALGLQSLQPCGDSPLSSTKEDIVVILTCDILQDLWGVRSPPHFSFFGILTLTCISLLLPLPVSCRQLSACLSGFPAFPSSPLPSLVCFMLCGSFYVSAKFFISIKLVDFKTNGIGLKVDK